MTNAAPRTSATAVDPRVTARSSTSVDAALSTACSTNALMVTAPVEVRSPSTNTDAASTCAEPPVLRATAVRLTSLVLVIEAPAETRIVGASTSRAAEPRSTPPRNVTDAAPTRSRSVISDRSTWVVTIASPWMKR